MIWVTRDYVHVDRVACPWLIKRFVDKKAQFVFLPKKEEIMDFVEKTGAVPYDVGGGELDHYEEDGEKFCSFDAIIKKYNLKDKALGKLRLIVRAADIGNMESTPLSYALEAIASGAPLLVNDDHEALELEFPFYDSLYAYLKREIVLEKFEDEIKNMKTRAERREFIKLKLTEV
ncbi:MAG: chromate resistance protein ChrB domain-containing protein [Candidatus Heimdallarchaeaceae archaeon]